MAKKMIKRLRVGGRSVSQGCQRVWNMLSKRGQDRVKSYVTKIGFRVTYLPPLNKNFRIWNRNTHYALAISIINCKSGYTKSWSFFSPNTMQCWFKQKKNISTPPSLPLNLELLKAQGTKFNLLILLCGCWQKINRSWIEMSYTANRQTYVWGNAI